MKKNNIFMMGLFVAATLFTTGCSDSFLEVDNPTGEPLEEYYTTDAHIQEALVAAYDPLHWPDWGLGQYNALNIDAEIMGDDFWVGGANAADMQNWHMLFNYVADENNTLSSLWTVDYSGIKRCNDVLAYLPLGTDLTEANRASYEMQARTLRVFYYNMLWHYFGNVPFYLENLSNPPYTAPQLTADEVYDQLIVELEAIIDSNVLPMNSKCVLFGHTPTTYIINEPKILAYPARGGISDRHNIAHYCKVHLDTGASMSGVLGCFCTDTCQAFYVKK